MSIVTSFLRTSPSEEPARVASVEADRRDFDHMSREEFRDYMQEAHAEVRLTFGYRWAICVITRDRYGLVADVASLLHEKGFNVEGAAEATIGEVVCLSFVASRTAAVGKEELDDWLSRVIDRGDHLFLTALNSEMRVMPAGSYRMYHLFARMPDRPGQLAEATRLLASEGGILHNFTTGIEQDAGAPCVLDINVAMPWGCNEDSIRESLGGLAAEAEASIEFTPQNCPLLRSLTINSTSWRVPPADLQYVVIVGNAAGGLIASVAEGFARGGFNVVASSMAILAGRTTAIFGLTPDCESPASIEECLTPSAEKFGLETGMFQDSWSTPDAWSEDSHGYVQVYAKSPEQPGILAWLAGFLADKKVAIDRLSARVTGSDAASCVINMFVELPVDLTAEQLQRDLAASPLARQAEITVGPADDFKYACDY